ncbi:hypothetical protein DH2020_047587 [Rehmannia glutinosa]|uniref:Protein kinase domain-containing protein n=1 Tax=Rehmannia glutinosa TaxID=99300 RepID=A0ABR0U828_REHGL
MDGNLRTMLGIFRRLGARALIKRRIIVGLKSDNCSRDMLLRLLHLVAVQGDSVLAVHVQQSDDDTFDPNTFHIHEDLCKSKQLLIMDDGGKILFQEMGTSQQGSSYRICRTLISSLSESSSCNQPRTLPPVRKSLSMPTSTSQQTEHAKFNSYKNGQQFFNFTFEELKNATEDFGPNMLIGEFAHSQVYKAILENGRPAAVKVFMTSQYSEDCFLREVEILSALQHENIVRLIGYCYCNETYALVYNLLNSSLKQKLSELKWNERLQIAIGVAKALEYIHSCYPPLSGFGYAKADLSNHQSSGHKEPTHIGTFGYLAPEYIMYGKVDEKIDVYSYGVVLLELIIGKEAVQTSQERFVVWVTKLETKS